MEDDYLDDNFEDEESKIFDDEFEPEPDDLEKIENGGNNNGNELAVRILKQVHESLGLAIEMLEGEDIKGAQKQIADLVTSKRDMANKVAEQNGSTVVEGVFNGVQMVGSDGKRYDIPPNYASKSKMVEGDVLKLTILRDGSFIYKQIRPVERSRLIGQLAYDEEKDAYAVVIDEDVYDVLTASVTYYKGEPGDEVTLLVPKAGGSRWGAIDNILKK